MPQYTRVDGNEHGGDTASALEKPRPVSAAQRSVFNTPAYANAREQLGAHAVRLMPPAKYSTEDPILGFVQGRWPRRTLEIPSTACWISEPESLAALRAIARTQHLTGVLIGSYDGVRFECPSVGRVTSSRHRFEFVIDLSSFTQSQLGTNHRRNLAKARKHGLHLHGDVRDHEALDVHLALCTASMARREVRGEAVPTVDNRQELQALIDSGSGSLFQARHEQTVVSSIFILRSETTLYYMSAGTSRDGMELGASPFLVCEIALWARERGVTTFNLGGAEPENAGLWRFKSGFGAEQRPLIEYSLSLLPVWFDRGWSRLGTLRRNPRAALQSVIATERYLVHERRLAGSVQAPALPPGVTIAALTREQLDTAGTDQDLAFSASKVTVHDPGCAWGAFIDSRLVHISWLLDTLEERRQRVAVVGLRRGEVEITHCATSAEARGRGIYPLMIRHLSSLAQQRGASRVLMLTAATNQASIRGMQKAGLDLVGTATRLHGRVPASWSIVLRTFRFFPRSGRQAAHFTRESH